jgi:hypothetical protein
LSSLSPNRHRTEAGKAERERCDMGASEVQGIHSTYRIESAD